ncbi:MAG: hypothetical protein Q8861_07715 [Bacteroidota bacterium]|nr:hypothetical protein [Bacteroidota bacterium]
MKDKITIPFLILLLTLYSCQKEFDTKYVHIEHSWSLDSAVYGDGKILLNSVPINDSILAVANSYSIKYIYTNNLKYTFTIFIPGHDLYSSGLVRPSLTKDACVTRVDKNNLAIFNTYMPTYMNGIPVYFSPTYSLSSTSVKGIPPATIFNSGYPIIKSKYTLIPYETDFTAERAFFSLITFDTSNFCNITSTKNIVIDNSESAPFYDGAYYSWTFYDKFFVTYYGQSFRIDTLGNVKSLLSDASVFKGKYIEQMFTLNNHLFALGWNTMFVSNDQGESWQIFADLGGTNWGRIQYFNVGSEVYAIYLSQIFSITLNGNTLNFQELDNDGLVGNQITSINKCGKYAFITTLSGLYYRDITTLNTKKK